MAIILDYNECPQYEFYWQNTALSRFSHKFYA